MQTWAQILQPPPLSNSHMPSQVPLNQPRPTYQATRDHPCSPKLARILDTPVLAVSSAWPFLYKTQWGHWPALSSHSFPSPDQTWCSPCGPSDVACPLPRELWVINSSFNAVGFSVPSLSHRHTAQRPIYFYKSIMSDHSTQPRVGARHSLFIPAVSSVAQSAQGHTLSCWLSIMTRKSGKLVWLPEESRNGMQICGGSAKV